MTITIEKGIPIPARKPGGGRKPKYPFDQMEVGDSILLDSKSGMSKKIREKLKPKVFRTALMDGKARIWRTE